MTARGSLHAVLMALCCFAGAARAQEGGDSAPVALPEGNVCIDCHRKQPGSLGAVVEEWRSSSHGRAGVPCDGCHRGDPKDEQFAHSPSAGFVATPRLREVPYFCGRCHAEITEKHLGSPHGAHGLPNCVTCHGSHDVQPPDPADIITEAACTKCHPFEPATKALDALQKARGLLAELETLTDRIGHIPAVREHVAVVQEEMSLNREGVVTTFHSFRIGDIEGIGRNVDRLEKTLERLYERETKRQENVARERPIIVLLMGFLVLATIFGFVVFHGTGTIEAGK